MPDKLILRWKQEGNVPCCRRRRTGGRMSARNFLGFRDGSANPDSADAALMRELVWVGCRPRRAGWAERGSYQAVRIIAISSSGGTARRSRAAGHHRPPEDERCAVRRPHRARRARLCERSERQGDAARCPHPPRNPRTALTEKNRILRRPFNYSNGVSKSVKSNRACCSSVYQAISNRASSRCRAPQR